MRRTRAIIVFAALAGATPAQATPARVASINLCTDQLLLTLADPAQIAGLSPYARDPVQSYAAARAAPFRLLSGGAEDVLELRPDLVLASSFTTRSTREFLRDQRLPIAEFEVATTIDDVKAQIRRAGDLLGHPDRARTQIEAIDAALARARAAASKRPLRILAVSRRGWIDGRGTLVDSLLNELGLRNAAGDLARHSGGFAALESILVAQPDALLVSEPGDYAADQSQAFLLHPALEDRYPPARRIVLPERLTVCAGSMLAEAIDRLADDFAKLEVRPGGNSTAQSTGDMRIATPPR